MNPITREESLLDGQDLEPITRKEQFIKRIYDKTQEIPEPITREEWFLKKAGEGTSPVAVEQLNVTENGTYSETGKAYSPVIVDVPAPTLITKTITENGTYNASEDNADGYSQVTANIPLGTKTITANGVYNASDDDLAGYSQVTAGVVPIYGFHLNGAETDPAHAITYIADNINAEPAYMDYVNDRFEYGSWKDAWFIRDLKPCILNQDGTVRCYLNKNDYSKDVEGNTVAIDETLTGANVMIEFPKIWMKFVPDANDDTSCDVYFSQEKQDDGYTDYPYIAMDGVTHKEHFYMPAFNGSVIDNVLRSIAGQTSTKCQNLDASGEIAAAQANGSGWWIECAGQIMLINMLLLLISRNTDTQATFGEGISSGSQTAFDNYVTGTLKDKGLFYGSNGTTTAVKVFGIENWWALQWRRYSGDICKDNEILTKMCWGKSDGSTVDNYNLDGTGYVDIGASPATNYLITQRWTSLGCFTKTTGLNTSSLYKDYYYVDASGVRFACRGGSPNSESDAGAFYVSRYSAAGYRFWYVGACPSFT